MMDIRETLYQFSLPTYILVDHHFAFCLTEADTVSDANLDQVSFRFSRRSQTSPNYVQRIAIDNCASDAAKPTRLALNLGMLLDDDTIGDGTLLPPALKAIKRWPEENLRSNIQYLIEIFTEAWWRPYWGSGLHFRIADWGEGPMPVGVAYSYETSPLVLVTSVGLSHADFLVVLQSLYILRPENERLIHMFQEELRTRRKQKWYE
jgi:hypothetical protein